MRVLRRLAGAAAIVAVVLGATAPVDRAATVAERRAQVQDFARSLAGDLTLSFVWEPLVSGYGGAGSYGGHTAWNTAHGGYATVTFSESIAADWHRNPSLPSLVAHEVGHAMTARCVELYREAFGSDGERFATAWAIGHGYEEEGNGEALYGRPSDRLIELSRVCR